MAKSNEAWTTDLAQLNATRADLSVAPAADGLAAWEGADLLLVAAPRWFDRDIAYPPSVVHAGPLGIRVGRHSRGRRPLVALGFSTTVMDGQTALIQRVCDALADGAVDAVLTFGGVTHESLATPPNVEAVSLADHDDLFPRCSAVVSHGGLGTALRALAHGVPLLLLPLGRDQQINAERVVELEAGLHLDRRAPAERIRQALDELIVTPRYRAAAGAAARRIEADEPDDVAVAAVEAVARGVVIANSKSRAERG
jgi:UDP:flavonoid glycosyltransferase YjiC (YdhE family)